MSECWLYYMYCDKVPSSKMIYAGITDSPSSRMGNHQSQKWWWWLVDSVQWEKCYTREEAEAKETELIKSARPLFNRSQSDLTGWERFSSTIHLLWSHSHNPYQHPTCPFCESHGKEEILSPDGPAQLFRRSCDDQLVIHFETSCFMHARHLEWAVHVSAMEFLRQFGKAPHIEAERFWDEGIGEAPWENRIERMATLSEMVDSVIPALASDASVGLIEELK
jgi:predicted GIY-YIG superfamily endonuclease